MKKIVYFAAGAVACIVFAVYATPHVIPRDLQIRGSISNPSALHDGKVTIDDPDGMRVEGPGGIEIVGITGSNDGLSINKTTGGTPRIHLGSGAVAYFQPISSGGNGISAHGGFRSVGILDTRSTIQNQGNASDGAVFIDDAFRIKQKICTANCDADQEHTIICDTTGGDVTVTIPETQANRSGRRFRVFKPLADNDCIIARTGATDTFNGATSVTLSDQYGCRDLEGNNDFNVWITSEC
jgi:hypothetical protein